MALFDQLPLEKRTALALGYRQFADNVKVSPKISILYISIYSVFGGCVLVCYVVDEMTLFCFMRRMD